MYSPDLTEIPSIPGPPPRLGVLASGSGTNFDAIAGEIEIGALEAHIECAVCNNPGARVFDVAERHEITARLIDHRDYDERIAFDREVLSVLEAHEVEWVIMAGWMRLVTPGFIDAYDGRILNIHPSLLPSFRGIDAVEQALEAGVKITGVTVHHVVQEMDAGPIIAQAAVPVLPEDDVDCLHSRIQKREHRLFPRAIAMAIADARS